MISTSRTLPERARDYLRMLGREPERLLHPLRRRRALAQLASSPPPLTVLMVCQGNICRSPYAAARARALLGAVAVRVESAGFVGPHREPPPDAVAVAAARGLEIQRHRSRLLTRGSAGGADLVVVMEPGQRTALHRQFGPTRRKVIVLGDLDPSPSATRAILDPVAQPRKVFAECYERIDRCIGALIVAAWPEPRARE